MKKIAYCFFAAFLAMVHVTVYADTPNTTGARPLDVSEKMELDWSHLSQPLADVFKTADNGNKFLDVLLANCEYDDNRQVVIASMADLYAVCFFALKKINGGSVSAEQGNQCLDFSIAVTANILGKEEMRARNEAALEERDANAIYEITSVSRRDGPSLNTNFYLKLQSFIVNKYCKDKNATISCILGEIQCDLVENTKYLERDLQLMCDNSKWGRYYENGQYVIRLKRE